MRNININFRNNTIELSSTFAKNASNYGTDDYNKLMNAKRDFPDFTIAVMKAPKKNNVSKGWDLEKMEKYIIEKSGIKSEQMATFKEMCGDSDDKFAARASYGEIRYWFFTAYPELENPRAKIDEIMKKAREEREARKRAEAEDAAA